MADVRILSTWQPTPTLTGVRLDLGDQAQAYRSCGQYLVVPVDGKKGYFAFATPPEGPEAELLIKPAGAVAEHLARQGAGALLPGATVEGRGYPLERARERDVLLVGIGCGVAPLRAMLRRIMAERSMYKSVTLLEGQRSENEFPYPSEHATWRDTSIRVLPIVSRPTPGYRGATGRVQSLLESALEGAQAPEVFLCGSREMIDDFKQRLAAAGVTPEHIHLNY